MSQPFFVSASSLVDRLFKFNSGRGVFYQKKFFREVIEGIIVSRSPLVSNIARTLNEGRQLRKPHRRLCRMLKNLKIPWEELRLRLLELASWEVQRNDVIAFDPGEITKSYAKKMESLYPVHDGSSGGTRSGYEDFSVEAIQYRGTKRYHIPLYQKITNASRPDYISQNHQICEAIKLIYESIGNKGIWTFDRGHDRGALFKKALFPLGTKGMRWIVRVNQDRNVTPVEKGAQESYSKGNKTYWGLMNLARQIPHYDETRRLQFPQKTAPLFIGWEKILFVDDPTETKLTLLSIHDKRNEEPVFLVTNVKVETLDEAIKVFGYYIERWRKEEGYRFTKSIFNLENLRVQSFESIENLSFLVWLSFFFVTLFYRSGGTKLMQFIKMQIHHFKPPDMIQFRYGRVVEIMRISLVEQRKLPFSALQFTEIG